jgi:6-pyruvoyltetrahydropterin/6-carboxytetrahydropterin synthase
VIGLLNICTFAVNRLLTLKGAPGIGSFSLVLGDGRGEASIKLKKKEMVYLTRRERFNAAHKLWIDDWSEEENRRVFGKCANKNWHGHNYELFVTVKGTPDPQTGFIMDVKKLSKLIKASITDVVDHSNLNLDVPFIPRGMQPTTENLVIQFWKELEPLIEGCTLHSIRLHETENIYAEYFGE